MKKAISLLAASMLLCGSLFIAAAAQEPVYEDGTAYAPNFANAAPNWSGVCIDNTDYKLDNVAAAQWNTTEHPDFNYHFTLPGVSEKTDPNYWARVYLNGPEQAQYATSGDTQDLGLCFTAPEAGAYRLDMAATAEMTNSDGMKLLVFDKSFTKVEDAVVTNEAYTLSKTFELAAGEKVYLFFNKNGHTSSDSMTFTTLKMTGLVTPLSAATFTPADITGIPAVKGSTYRQFFNIKADPSIKSLWKAFYISDQNKVESLVKDGTYDMWVFPDELKSLGVNQYSQIWEGLNNAFMPSDTHKIGDYFTAPVQGKVTVYAKLQYATDPGDNPAAADGVGVTVYKNKISEDAVVLQRTLVDYANSGEKGLELKAENVAVDAGDVLIFVYDNNGTPYSDNTKVLDKYVAYTETTAAAEVFHCDTTKVRFTDGKFVALKSLTVEELLSAISPVTNLAAALDAQGNAIPVGSLPVEKAAQVAIYTQTGFYTVGTWSVEAVEAFPQDDNQNNSQGDNQGNSQENSQGGNSSPGTGVAVPIGLLVLTTASAAGVLLMRKKK